MQNFVQIYEANAALIQKFIASSLRSIDLKTLDEPCREQLFIMFPSLELIYECDTACCQTSPNYFRGRNDEKQIGADRSYLIFKRMGDIAFLNPYISIGTGSLCMTAICNIDNRYILFDFELKGLLECFNLIEESSYYRLFSRISYGIFGYGLLFFAIFIMLYGFVTFFSSLFLKEGITLDIVFKPVIALTLGLAVFDLGKTIIEQEVLPKTKNIIQGFIPTTLMNFSTSIIIALLIETLLVVFKISISNYHDLPFASELIAALAFLLLVFAIFTYLIRKSEPMKDKEA